MRPSAYPLLEFEAAARLVLERTPVLGTEEVALERLAGRITAFDVQSPRSLPELPLSAVDGYAHRARPAPQVLRVVGESAAGRPFAGRIQTGQAVRIMTGAVVPPGADTVVMLEDVHVDGEEVSFSPRPRGSNVNPPGADVEAGDVILGQGTRLGAAEVGILAAVGVSRLAVRRRPRVALLSTGDELVEVGQPLAPGRIYDSNRWALSAAVAEAGATVDRLGMAPDDAEALGRLIEAAMRDHDVLITSGGVSVGAHDLVKPLLERLGEVHVGRVKVRPGKPFTFATLPEGRLAFGLPGFPVSSLVTFEVFVRPALRRMQGASRLARPNLRVRLGYEARPAPDRTDFQRVVLQAEAQALVAYSTGRQASSRLLSLAGAQALVKIPPGEAPLPPGSEVEALILDLEA